MSLTQEQSERSASSGLSSVSVKSDRSREEGPNFSEKTPSVTERSASPVFSSVSLKSDNSKADGPNFSEKTPSDIKSERWQETLINIGSEITRWKTLKEQRGIKSDEELTTCLLDRIQCETSAADLHYFEDDISCIFQGLENKIAVFFKNELERFKKILKNENTQYYVKDFKENKNNIRETALDVTIHFLRSMKQDELADTLEDELIYTCQLKSDLEKKCQCVFEGIAKQGDSTLLNKIYTDLYITQGGGEQVNTEHEIRQIEVASRHLESPDIQINFKDLFKPHEQTQTIRTVLTKGVAGIGKSVSVQKFVLDWAEGKENQDISFIFPLPFREMNLKEKAEVNLKDLLCKFFPEIKGLDLTRKNKKVLFILDGLDECRLPLKFDGNEIWSDITSPAPLDVLLTNLIKGDLLPHSHIWITTRPAAAGKIPPECIDRVTEVRGFNDEQKKEYFRKRFTDQNMADTIIDHVKKSKSLFIMCHIPVFCWISATVLENILEKKSKDQTDDTQESNTDDTPRTLTQMYTHFFRFQIQQSRRKYDGEYSPDISWDMDSIYSLGKLAFEQLERNNLIFYESDLEECGIDVSKASVYSGMCTQIFKQETGIILGTVYCFVHLSIQEFIAALYAHLFLDKNKKHVFVQEHMEPEAQNETLTGLLKTAVDKALESDNGHLDLFLRFLLGLSLESNRRLLRGLLSQEESHKQNNTEIVQYIKKKFEHSLCPERSINLFYCLNELNDQTLVQEIQKHLSEGSLSSSDLSPAQWSALTFVLLTSDEELTEFELQKFKKSDECLIRLLPVVKSSKHALLNDCNLTDKSCSALAEVLSSDNSLEELNMSNNNLQDSGVKLLCAGLKNIKCELKKLSVSKCDITEESCSALAAVLSSDSCTLKDLNMSRNNLQDDGVKRLSEGLKNTNCELNKLSLSECSIGEEGYNCLYSAVRSNPESHLIELDLRGNDPGETGVKLIYQLIQDHKCELNTVRFLSSSSAVKAFEYLTETLGINPLLQREVNLSDHKLDESRVNQICDLLKDKHCRINTFILRDCGLTEESCSALASVLSSNISVKELDMSNNHLQDSGVKRLSDGLKNNCKLHKLTFLSSSSAVEVFEYLTETLGINPLLQREVNLSDHKLDESRVNQICDLLKDKHCRINTLILSKNKLEDSGMMKISDLLKNPHCRLHKLDLTECSIGEEELDLRGNDPGETGVKLIDQLIQDHKCKLNTVRFLSSSSAVKAFEYLTETLGINPLLQREVNLSDHKLDESRVNQICDLLKDKHCHINTLILSNSSITAGSFADLISAIKSKPSHLKHLDLSGNKLEDSVMMKISELLGNAKSKLQKLNLSECSIGEEGYKCLYSAVRSNPESHLIELDLRGNDPGETGVKLIYQLIQDHKCKLNTVRFLSSSSAVKAFEYLTETLGINPLLQREVNLSDHKLDESRVNQICDLLKDKHCRINTFILRDCGLTEESCSALASVLSSNISVKELDMSNNHLQDSGVKRLSDGLKNNCKLHKLTVSECSIGEEGYKCLYSAVRSNPESHLIELDLRGNDPGETGVKLIYQLIQDHKCKLNTVRFLSSSSAVKAFEYLTETLGINPLLQREVNLSDHKLDESRVNQICDLLKDKHCHINTLILTECSIGEEGYKCLYSAVRSNPESHLIELDLRGNDPGETGVKLIYQLIQDHKCKLNTVRFLKTCAAEEACDHLCKALDVNPLLLKELNLSHNKLGDLDGEKLSALLMDSHSKVTKIILNDCELTENQCSALAAVLSCKTLVKEMNLSNSPLMDSGLKHICDQLKNPQCQLQILKLRDCGLTEESCSALASVLSSNISVKELDMSNNHLQDSGVKRLSDGLKNNCKLHKLTVSECSIGEEGVKLIYQLIQDHKCKLNTVRFLSSSSAVKAFEYLTETLGINPLLQREVNLSDHKLDDLSNSSITAGGFADLISAIKSKPSHLKHLDLSGNKLEDSVMMKISELLENAKSKLQKLKFLSSSSAVKAFEYLTETLGINPLLQREVNLSDHKLDESRVNQICDLLKDKHCHINTLILRDCGLTEESCSALASVLSSNISVKELDMSNNHLQDSGVKRLSDGLKNNCKLHKLTVSECSIGEEELDLRGNDPGETGVKRIYQLIQDHKCKLNTVRFLSSSSAVKAFEYLTETLGINPLLQREVNLSDHKLDESRVNQICDLLKDKHCHINTLILSKNKLEDSGMMKISDLLRNSQCRLHKLEFLKSCAAEEACDHLCKALDVNPLLLKELNLSHNKLGDLDGEKLSALLMDSHSKVTKIILNDCELTENQCSALAAVLSCKTLVKEMNLSNSPLMDSGLKHICDQLKNPQCQLQILKLRDCGLTEESCSALASVLSSNISMKELDMSNNHLQDSGVKRLSDGLKNNCKLHKLTVSECSIGEEGVKLIYQLIQDHKCKLNTVRFLSSSSAVEAFEYLTETLGINPLLQREVNLSDHKLDESRVNQICDLLKDKHCHINTLILSKNKLEDSGMMKISDLLENSQCRLHKLEFLKTRAAEEACDHLCKALDVNPLLLKELNLSHNKLGDLDGEKLSALLMDSHSKVTKIILNDCELTENQCSALAAVLSCKTLVKEMNLSNSPLMDSGLKHICDQLKNPQCQLQILKLRDCGLTEESCSALASVLSSNISVKELDMSNNHLQDSGVKRLSDGLKNNCKLHKLTVSECSIGEEGVKLIYQLIQDHKCKLNTVRFLSSSSAVKAFEYLTETLGINPLLQREVNLSDHELDESRVNQICDLLKDKHCHINTLIEIISSSRCHLFIFSFLLSHFVSIQVRACGLTDEGLVDLTSALNSNPSHLRKLDLSLNPLRDSGVEHLCALLSNSQFRLKTLRVSGCSITMTQLDKLISALCSNPSHLRELNLSGNEIKDTGVKLLCRLLKHSQCKLEKLNLYKCHITDVTALADTLAQTQALKFLKVLDLRYSNIKDQKRLHEVLKSSNCKLSLFWPLLPKLRDVQLSSDEEDGDTSSQNVKPKDQVEGGQSTDRDCVVL
ncbi:uncharacterized protein LOC130429844 [Triplophysa dalaica]|uniref:uncharacterized protein LOC130429844 n=1 Tax=Triplophysa dalaica TaxID=1582913 RepID=UPI0024E02DE6|nr:uncharacterized protein LOC130429844 [Triplophysa dalaica]